MQQRAQATICEVGGLGSPHGKPFHVSQCPPELNYWVEPYVRLVRTAHSFEHMFLEPDLRGECPSVLSQRALRMNADCAQRDCVPL